MEFLTEYWLSLAVGLFLLSMILYGHYRGFLRMAVSMLALVVSIAAVPLSMPHVNRFFYKNTTLHRAIGRGLLDLAGFGELEQMSEGFLKNALDGVTAAQLPSLQREVIERLHLPEQMKDALLAHNNNEIYELLGVDQFLDYLGSYLANMVLNLVGGIILFTVLYVGIRLLIRWLDLIARLPILHGMNQIAGAVLGGAQGLLAVWFLFLLVRIASGTQWAQAVLAQIHASLWLHFLYEENLFNWIFTTVLNGLAH